METQDDPTYMTPRLKRWRQLTDWPLMVIAVGSLPILLLEIDKAELQRSDQLFIDVVNWFVLVAFAVDYVVELLSTRERAAYVRHEWASLLIVLSQGLALLPVLAPLGVLRAARAGRLFRFFAIAARAVVVGGTAAKSGRTMLREHAAGLALGTAGFTWVFSAAAFTVAERGSERPHSFSDALWWSVSTIATVGYGDIYPVTPVGRVIGAFTMVVGISAFAVVTAKVAQFLVRSDDASAATLPPG